MRLRKRPTKRGKKAALLTGRVVDTNEDTPLYRETVRKVKATPVYDRVVKGKDR